MIAFPRRQYLRLRHFRWMSSEKVLLSSFGEVLGGEKISPVAFETFQAWHHCLKMSMSGQPLSEQNFGQYVDDKCKFSPPTYFTSWTGRDEFITIISCVSEVFGPSFTYKRQWLSPDGHDWALEFTTEIGKSKLKIDGIDLVKLNQQGQIVDFTVLARPPNGVSELKSEMMKKAGPKIAALKAKQFASSIFGKTK
jgi:hypothetical protein